MKHLERQHILTDYQHGFWAKKSTETQLILTIHDLRSELNKNNLVDVAVLDFTKAFDKVPHCHLISKLQYYGLNGEISTWVKNFLTGCTQKVVINGHTSCPADVTSGVPQGTVVLFGSYSTSMICQITSPPTQDFLQMTLLFYQFLQNDLKLLESWRDTWL